MATLWLILFGGFVILELSTTQFICIWFAGGALAAFITALFNIPILVQTIVFVAVSLVFLLLTRRIVAKLKAKTEVKTNSEALIGECAVVTEDISNLDGKGSVKIRGIEWSARSTDGNTISKDSYVTVKEIVGVKLIVNKIISEEGE